MPVSNIKISNPIALPISNRRHLCPTCGQLTEKSFEHYYGIPNQGFYTCKPFGR